MTREVSWPQSGVVFEILCHPARRKYGGGRQAVSLPDAQRIQRSDVVGDDPRDTHDQKSPRDYASAPADDETEERAEEEWATRASLSSNSSCEEASHENRPERRTEHEQGGMVPTVPLFPLARFRRTPTLPRYHSAAKPTVRGSNRPRRLNTRIPGKEAVKNQKCRKLPV